ncbi:ABC transporter ATP-binding protein [Variovorax sp. WS11]|uniref:ABC transporter ATP-binding protein n=1 Tax=Variovorax sp. WS11 TaxID=1105204 RepID=UPI000D0CA900|nr:ABC transporter ATP-binding protein [Variovorax sp. WS11]NDZ17653.1 ABC transporter ATP-binding protein [Variovorax sp. WS11]PSL79567.1 ABC transporter ATP-binding protein [Variovorax sp. WS11]
MVENALEIRGLNKSFGALKVICNFDLSIPTGARHAIIGPNGAGKTTLFNLVTGWVRPTSGTVLVHGQPLEMKSPQAIVRAGFARSFQRNMLMEGLTVLENLRLACQAFSASRWQMFQRASGCPDVVKKAKSIAERLELDNVLTRLVRELSYGQKRQLEVAIALCAEPRILLMDEPAAGTSPSERKQLIALIRGLSSDLTLLLVDHDMDVVFELCGQITVLSYGKVLASGDRETVSNNPSVREAYLGKHARDRQPQAASENSAVH